MTPEERTQLTYEAVDDLRRRTRNALRSAQDAYDGNAETQYQAKLRAIDILLDELDAEIDAAVTAQQEVQP